MPDTQILRSAQNDTPLFPLGSAQNDNSLFPLGYAQNDNEMLGTAMKISGILKENRTL